MISKKLQKYISDTLGTPVQSISTVSGGSICSANKIELEDERIYFLKWHSAAESELISAEHDGLLEFSRVPGVRIPKIVHYYEGDNILPQVLLLEFLTQKSATVHDERALAKMLAKLHQTQGEHFGYGSENYIGTLPQLNSYSDSWGEFFVQMRLGIQAEIAGGQGWLRGELLDDFKAVLPAMKSELNALSEPPVLVHGDLWIGNVLWSEEYGPVLIDPAVYYGNREVDIACTKFISPLGEAFYEAYQLEYPMKAGYEVRFEMYNLYHTMTHANMFGGGYVKSFHNSVKALKRYLT